MEFEASWEASKTLKLSGNYSYQHSVDQATDEDAGNAPHHHVYVRADWRLVSGWSLHPQLNWISDRPRVAADTRDALKGYTTVDLTLRTESEGRPWSVSLSVRNLFDADVREPSPYDRTPGQPFISLPYDFPQAGRTFYVQASYTF
jgi:iron complex outermembrane receptor protein